MCGVYRVCMLGRRKKKEKLTTTDDDDEQQDSELADSVANDNSDVIDAGQ